MKILIVVQFSRNSTTYFLNKNQSQLKDIFIKRAAKFYVLLAHCFDIVNKRYIIEED